MTTEEIIEHIERWLSHPGFSHITREFLSEAAQRLREQEALIADLQKDRELEWVEDPKNHAGFQSAYELNQENKENRE
jgi:hypothetical protein